MRLPSSHLGFPLLSFGHSIFGIFQLYFFRFWSAICFPLLRLNASSFLQFGLSPPLIWGFPTLSFGAFHVLHFPVSFAQLITLLHPIRLSCMLELFVFSKVHFPESTQQGTAAVEARLLILSSPDPCKETIDEKGQKD